MRIQRIAIGLTVINLLLFMFLLAQIRRTTAQNVVPVLRGRALEIVDGQGRVRAMVILRTGLGERGQDGYLSRTTSGRCCRASRDARAGFRSRCRPAWHRGDREL